MWKSIWPHGLRWEKQRERNPKDVVLVCLLSQSCDQMHDKAGVKSWEVSSDVWFVSRRDGFWWIWSGRGSRSIQYHVNVSFYECQRDVLDRALTVRLYVHVSCDVTWLIVCLCGSQEVFAGLCCSLTSSLTPVISIQTPGSPGPDPRITPLSRDPENTHLTIQ